MADSLEPISHLEKVITGDVEPISHLEQIIALYGGSGGSVTGSSNLTANLISNTQVGGVEVNKSYPIGTNIEQIIRDILVKYVNPIATILYSNTNNLIEKGTSFNLIMTVSNIIKGTNNIAKIVYLDGNTELNVKTYNTSTQTYDYTVNNVNTDKTFKVRVYDTENKYFESTKTYTFIDPSYIGIVDTNSVDESIVTSLQKVLLNSNSYTYDNITMTNKRICFAYPKSFGDLISVKDANNFEVLGSFIKTDLTINGINYVAYVTNSTSSLNNGKLIFK